MTTELNPSPASEPQGAVQAQPQNGAPQSQNPQGQHPQGQGQGQGHRRRRRRRNKGTQGKGQQSSAPPPNGAPMNGASPNGAPSQPPASHHQSQQKQKPGKRFFQKSPGNQGGYNGNGFRPSPGNGSGNGNSGGRRKNKGGRRQQVFVGPMDHSYRGGANGNVADPIIHSQNNDFRGMPHSGFYSETDYVQPGSTVSSKTSSSWPRSRKSRRSSVSRSPSSNRTRTSWRSWPKPARKIARLSSFSI
jgi:hypothetical protein